MPDNTIGAMRFQRRSASLRAEPVALSQAKPAAAIASKWSMAREKIAGRTFWVVLRDGRRLLRCTHPDNALAAIQKRKVWA